MPPANLRNKPVAKLSAKDAAKELGTLAAEIAEHDAHYHGADAPVISGVRV